jgi:class 3 adenylate cyclase/tetratricopeptide (TPR) repeat protein
MKCPRCQHENRPGAKFCEECAAPLARACAKCGAQLSPTAKFCSECAHPASQAAPSTSHHFGAPEAYTPEHLAEKILSSRAALEDERKQVTVLFADLKGSMELLADRDPEEARQLLDPVLARMMEAVHRYEGTVNQVMGDGIMALFGAPLAHEDHAVRACYAALRMQDAVKQYAEDARRTHGIEVQIRVGLNSGEVVVRSIGSDLAMDYTAVGQTTHLAARMEQLATPGAIRITADTFALAEGHIEVKSLGLVPIKGVAAPVEVYEVLGAFVGRSRLQAAATRGLTKFVGRTAEMDQLHQAFERAKTGQGQVVAVVGEPGVGKSRLYWELIHSHRTHGGLVLESGSVSYGKATAYLPVIELLKVYFQVEPRDDARKRREKVTGKLLSLDRALEPSLPALLWLLDVAVNDAQWERLDPSQRRQTTLESVKRLLLRESQVQPLVVVFEDLHWIDAETQALLDGLVESLPTARVLLLVNYRPEYRHGWGGKTYYRQLRIDPLPPESAAALLNALLGEDRSLDPLKRLLIERTEGNPLFLEESVKMLAEDHVLSGERGAYRLPKPLQGLQIPATAQAILAARIDRLPPEEKRLLQSASVIGKDVPFALLQQIAGMSEHDLRRGVAHLQAAEFVYETYLFPEVEYTFKHALTHEVAYDSVLHDRRRALHAAIVEGIERLYPERLADQIDRLAHHAFRGEMWDKAVGLLRQAGVKAVARSAPREAATYFEQALVALGRVPESHDTITQAIDLRIDLQSALGPLGASERMLETLREAETLAETLGDQRRLGWVSAHMCYAFLWMGDADRAVESGKRALALASALGDLGLEVVTNFRLGQAHFALGEYRRAIDVLRQTIEPLQGELIRERFGLPVIPSANCRTWVAMCLANLGEFGAAIATAEDGLRIAETAEHHYSIANSCWGVAGSNLLRGDCDKVIRALEPSLELCRRGNFAFSFPWISGALGLAYACSGRVAQGLPLLEEAVEQSRDCLANGQKTTLTILKPSVTHPLLVA